MVISQKGRITGVSRAGLGTVVVSVDDDVAVLALADDGIGSLALQGGSPSLGVAHFEPVQVFQGEFLDLGFLAQGLKDGTEVVLGGLVQTFHLVRSCAG